MNSSPYLLPPVRDKLARVASLGCRIARAAQAAGVAPPPEGLWGPLPLGRVAYQLESPHPLAAAGVAMRTSLKRLPCACPTVPYSKDNAMPWAREATCR